MTDFGIWTSNAMIQAKAGASANATAKAISATDVYVLDVEAYVNVYTGYNWSDAYGTGTSLNADVQGILHDVTSALCAMYVIQWDMSGFTSRAEAQTMLDVLYDAAQKGLKELKEVAKRDFINKA